jgi:hypothetical protein
MKEIDYRCYKSIVSDLMKKWDNGKKEEYLAMEWISRVLYEKFIIALNSNNPKKTGGKK